MGVGFFQSVEPLDEGAIGLSNGDLLDESVEIEVQRAISRDTSLVPIFGKKASRAKIYKELEMMN